jgi:hypothetical protein
MWLLFPGPWKIELNCNFSFAGWRTSACKCFGGNNMLTFLGFVALAICIYIIGKLIALPFKIIKNIVIGLIVGSAAIWAVNLFGMGIEMNVVNALLASVVVYIISSFI